MSSKAEYNKQLGMNVATATHQLKQNLIFKLSKELNKNICIRCNLVIETSNELSVDHIKPWRNVSSELFWDLDNIAFSHKPCNKVDRPRRKVGPEGTAWCTGHKEFLNVSNFTKDNNRWDKLSSYCNICDSERLKKYEAKNPRHPCRICGYSMRKKCQKCGFDMPMKEYMALRRKEGVQY